MTSERIIDRTAGWLGIAFLVVPPACEVAVSLPDEHASAATVATSAGIVIDHGPAEARRTVAQSRGAAHGDEAEPDAGQAGAPTATIASGRAGPSKPR